MIAALPSLTLSQWLALVHPVLIIPFVYPVIGATIRLGILARERRLQLNPIAPTVPVEHVEHGRWPQEVCRLCSSLWAMDCGGGAGLATWLVVSLQAASPLPRGAPAHTALCSDLPVPGVAGCFCSLISLQPLLMEERSLLPSAIWESHAWGGLTLLALLLFTMAVQREIAGRLWMRQLHVSLNVLVALLLATQAITGTRNLLLG